MSKRFLESDIKLLKVKKLYSLESFIKRLQPTLTACCWAGFRDPLAGTKAEQRTEDEVKNLSWVSVPSAATEDE
jgi:hypothetical protein